MTAVPAVGGRKPVIIRMVVDFPAPFGPRKPRTSPAATEKDTPFTAWNEPKSFFRFFTSSMTLFCLSLGFHGNGIIPFPAHDGDSMDFIC